MKNKIKTILLSMVMFVAGIITTITVIWFFMMPDIIKDFSKLAWEGAYNAYQIGVIDGENGNTDMYECFGFDSEESKEIENWEYKYIK